MYKRSESTSMGKRVINIVLSYTLLILTYTMKLDNYQKEEKKNSISYLTNEFGGYESIWKLIIDLFGAKYKSSWLVLSFSAITMDKRKLCRKKMGIELFLHKFPNFLNARDYWNILI